MLLDLSALDSVVRDAPHLVDGGSSERVGMECNVESLSKSSNNGPILIKQVFQKATSERWSGRGRDAQWWRCLDDDVGLRDQLGALPYLM